jgi:hypothetical protein
VQGVVFVEGAQRPSERRAELLGTSAIEESAVAVYDLAHEQDRASRDRFAEIA